MPTRTRILLMAMVLLAVAAVARLALRFCGRAEMAGGTGRERIACIRRLAGQRPRGAEQVIIRAASGENDPVVREAAVAALDQFRSPAARPAVVAALEDPSPVVRPAAARTLGSYGDAPSAKRLARLAAEDADEGVRLAAIGGLVRNLCPEAIVALVGIMESDADRQVRRKALVDMIGRFGMKWRQPPDPDDADAWHATMRQLRRIPRVKSALSGAGGAGR